MRRALLASILVLTPAAALAVGEAAVPAAPSSPVVVDPDREALDLLREIRAQEKEGNKDTSALRAQLAVLRGAPADPTAGSRLERAADYLDLLAAGKPLPPPSADELGAGTPADPPAPPPTRQKEINGAQQADTKTSDLLDQVSDDASPARAAGTTFDGGKKRHPLPPVEVEPGPGYHTVNLDAWIGAADDAARLSALTDAVSGLIELAGEQDKGGKRAKALARHIATLVQLNPVHGHFTALRLRVRPDGKIVLIYRLDSGAVVEDDLDLMLRPSDPGATSKLPRRKKPKKKKKKSGGGGGDGGGGKGGKGGKKGKGGGGGDDEAGGGGRGGHGKRGGGKGGEDEGGDDGPDAEIADAGGPDSGAADAVDPDGAAKGAKRGRSASAAKSSGGGGESAPRVSLPGGFTTAGEPDGSAPSGEERAARGGRGGSGGGESGGLDLAALPRLSGAIPGARKARGAVPAPALPARAVAAAQPAPAPAAASVAAAAPPVYSAAEDGELRDAVAASAATAPPSPAAAARAAAPPRPAEAPAPSTKPALLLLASAALGAVGLFLQFRS